jgi:hypothetical protein
LAIENLKIKHLILAILIFEYGVLAIYIYIYIYIYIAREKKRAISKLSFPFFGNMKAKI